MLRVYGNISSIVFFLFPLYKKFCFICRILCFPMLFFSVCSFVSLQFCQYFCQYLYCDGMTIYSEMSDMLSEVDELCSMHQYADAENGYKHYLEIRSDVAV